MDDPSGDNHRTWGIASINTPTVQLLVLPYILFFSFAMPSIVVSLSSPICYLLVADTIIVAWQGSDLFRR
jgi:hypothetical protein